MPTKSKLDAYAAKRDFRKTAEPQGDSIVRASKRLRFVVQRHDATRLHYDLRLELDGVFKSWAVTKGPSLNPADKRLAVEVEDHPLGYGDFEGTIPKGQYGGGTVQLFDRGTWAPEGKIAPDKALAQGELKFVLEGKRLKGSFVLVRMKKDRFGGKRTNWLLIKHLDDAANDEADGGGIPGTETSIASGRTLDAIAAGTGRAPTPFMLPKTKAPARDAIWDSSKGLAHTKRQQTPSPKAKPDGGTKADPMPDFVIPQLCRSVDKPPSGSKWLHEIKFDGYRMQLRVENRTAVLRTRTGLDWTGRFPAIAKAAAKLPDLIIDGEIVALDRKGHPSFSALQTAIADAKTDALAYFAFDLLFYRGNDLRRTPLKSRKSELKSVIEKATGGGKRLRYVEHFDADGSAVYQSAKDLGLEGIISKQAHATYKSGRSESWTKSKCRVGHEIVLGGWTETSGKFRSLLGGVFRDGLLAYVGRIGTGYGAAVVATLMPKLKANASAKSPFKKQGAPPRDRDIHWLKPVLVAEVEFADWSSDGLVRQAAFKGLREDKPAQEITIEAPATPRRVKMPTPGPSGHKPLPPTTKARGRSSKPSVMGVTLSNADKPLWPDDGDGVPVTKQDLALYFETIGEWMLPHIIGRPCSIIRAPDGIDNQTFFQRHAMAGGSDLFDTIRIAGDREPYLVLNRVEALAAVAQSGGVELHPSNCLPDQPDVPGRLVFDLDPAPDVAFDDVIGAAKTLKTMLEALGLNAFCKTTGGKGLHVVTPLTMVGKKVDWKTAKTFARDVCGVLEREAPDLFLTKASKAARKGRIYLDYLRNDRLSTAVAPLSPRARPQAPVSMPLTWPQVKAGLDPARFTVRTVPGLLKRSQSWADYAEGARPISKAIGALRKL